MLDFVHAPLDIFLLGKMKEFYIAECNVWEATDENFWRRLLCSCMEAMVYMCFQTADDVDPITI